MPLRDTDTISSTSGILIGPVLRKLLSRKYMKPAITPIMMINPTHNEHMVFDQFIRLNASISLCEILSLQTTLTGSPFVPPGRRNPGGLLRSVGFSACSFGGL